MEYTFHQLEIETHGDSKSWEIIKVDPYEFLKMLGDLGMRATIEYDDATQHLVYAEFPVRPVEAR